MSTRTVLEGLDKTDQLEFRTKQHEMYKNDAQSRGPQFHSITANIQRYLRKMKTAFLFALCVLGIAAQKEVCTTLTLRHYPV